MDGLKIRLSCRTRSSFLGLLGWAIVIAGLHPTVRLAAQDRGKDVRGTGIPATAELIADPPQWRTLEHILKDAESRGPTQVQRFAKPFLPTISEAEYQQLKADAAAAAILNPRTMGTVQLVGPLAPPVLTGVDIDGRDETTSCSPFTCTPPDTHGAVGFGLPFGKFVEVTNLRYDVFDTLGTNLLTVPLPSLFATEMGDTVFDPRVLYDRIWNRWVLILTRIANSATDPARRFYLAISESRDPRGPFCLYQPRAANAPFADGDWFDFPIIGMNQDAIVITANVFSGPLPDPPFRFPAILAIAKARLYNCLPFTPAPIFTPTGVSSAVAPPVVLDQNPNTFFLAAPVSGNTLTKLTMTNPSRPNGTTLVSSSVPVDPYTMPAPAPQPGTDVTLSTLDSRFANNTTQVGDSVFAAHTVANGFAAPKYYEINTATNAVIQSAFWGADLNSSDFNVSIVANDAKDVFVTWSSTNASNGVNAEVRVSGRCHSDALNTMNPPGSALITSSTFYNERPGRWGDYSGVTIDPGDGSAWFVNEYIKANTTWGSRIGSAVFDPACPQ